MFGGQHQQTSRQVNIRLRRASWRFITETSFHVLLFAQTKTHHVLPQAINYIYTETLLIIGRDDSVGRTERSSCHVGQIASTCMAMGKAAFISNQIIIGGGLDKPQSLSLGSRSGGRYKLGPNGGRASTCQFRF